MSWVVHINRNLKQSNGVQGTSLPVIRFQEGEYDAEAQKVRRLGPPTYANRVKFNGEVLYKPDGEPILPCGARLIILCDEQPEIIE